MVLCGERGRERALEAHEHRETTTELVPAGPELYGVGHPTRRERGTAGDEVCMDGVCLNPRLFESKRRPAGARNVTPFYCTEAESSLQIDQRGPCDPPGPG